MRSWALALACLAIGCAIPSATIAATPSTCIPIEVEVEGAVGREPADDGFRKGFQSGLREAILALRDTTRATRTIANAFCFASDRPSVRPLHIRVRVRTDAIMISDYFRPAPDAIRKADHLLVHIAVPFRGMRLAPASSHRLSMWARSDREKDSENIGHAIALCVLETLSHETGRLSRDELLALGSGITRDPKYSEDGADGWAILRHSLPLASPMLFAWGVLLVVAFVAVRFVQSHLQRAGQSRGATPPGSF